MTPDLQSIESQLDAAMEKAKADGWTIVQESCGSVERKQCCAMSAYRRDEKGDVEEVRTCSDFGITIPDYWAIISGFDGLSIDHYDTRSVESHPFYAIGQRLRAKHLKP